MVWFYLRSVRRCNSKNIWTAHNIDYLAFWIYAKVSKCMYESLADYESVLDSMQQRSKKI